MVPVETGFGEIGQDFLGVPAKAVRRRTVFAVGVLRAWPEDGLRRRSPADPAHASRGHIRSVLSRTVSITRLVCRNVSMLCS